MQSPNSDHATHEEAGRTDHSSALLTEVLQSPARTAVVVIDMQRNWTTTYSLPAT